MGTSWVTVLLGTTTGPTPNNDTASPTNSSQQASNHDPYNSQVNRFIENYTLPAREVLEHRNKSEKENNPGWVTIYKINTELSIILRGCYDGNYTENRSS